MEAAFRLLLMSKDELTDFAREMMEKDTHSLEEFAEGLARVERNLKGLTHTVETASARLVAAAYCAVPPDDNPGGGLEAAA